MRWQLALAWTLLCAARCGNAQALTLEGRVVDIQASAVLAGAEVRVGEVTTRSDGAGFFRLEHLSPGAMVVAVLPKEGPAFRARLRAPDRERFFVELDRARHGAPEGDEDY